MNTLQRGASWLTWALRQRGVAGALRLALGKLRRRGRQPTMIHPFDTEYGVDTSGLIEGGILGAGHRHAAYLTAYAGVPPSRMCAVLDRWFQTPGVLPVAEYAFVDIGCGKGRALMLSSAMPFREAIGVELDAGLAQICSHNIDRWHQAGQTQCPVMVLHGDATEVPLPDGPLVVYLYNPFRAPVLRRLLERLQQRTDPTEVLYLYPLEEAVFGEFPSFEMLWKAHIPITAEDIGADGFADLEDPCSAYRLRNANSAPPNERM